MEEINKFLTKAMGECWHDWKLTQDDPPFRVYECWECDTQQINPGKNNNFLTWKGFGKLWGWAEMELWWCRFLDSLEGPLSHYVNPENFAKAVAGYLQKK